MAQDKPKFDPTKPYTASNGAAPSAVQDKPKFNPDAPFEKKNETTESVPASEDGTTVPASASGSTQPASDTPPTEKPTARTKLKTRVKNLSALYQGRFQDELQPILDTQQKEYASQVNSKKDKLQALVDSGKIKVEDANTQLKEFNDARKSEADIKIKSEQDIASTKFDQKYGKEISKWLELYNTEYAKEDFQENKITNPLKSFGRSAWTTFTMDLPAATRAARALGQSAKGKIDQKIMNAFEKVGLPQVDPENAEGVFNQALKFITGATDAEIEKHSEIKAMTMDAASKKIVIDELTAATELSNASAESKKYLINNLDKVKSGDWLDIMNYVASAAGQGAGQIPVSVGTRGTTSLIQEMGSIYLDSVHKISQETGLSIEEVIKQGKDDVVFPLIFGIGAGLLDAYGANRIGKLFGKDQVMSSFRKRAVEVGKVAGYETITEGAQGALEEIGINKAAGKSWMETFQAINPDVIKESAIQGGIAGMFLGGAGQIIRSGITAITTPTVKPKFQPVAQEVAPIDAAVARGAKVSLQADKPTATVIEEAKATVDPKNPESVATAAETIQKSFDEKQEAKPSGVDAPVGSESTLIPPGTTVSLSTDPSAVQGVRPDAGTEVGQKTSQPIADDKGTYDFSGVRQRLSQGEETPATETKQVVTDRLAELTAVRKFIKPLPEQDFDDAEANANWKALIEHRQRLLTDDQYLAEQIDLVNQGKKASQRVYEAMLEGNLIKPTKTDEQATTTEVQAGQPSDQVLPVQEQTGTTQEAVMPVSTEQPLQPTPQVEGDKGSYVFSRPVQPTPDAPDTTTQPATEATTESPTEGTPVTDEGGAGVESTPPPTGSGAPPTTPPPTKVSDKPSSGVSGERETIVKLQEQSTLAEPLKKGIEDFKEYAVKKQSLSRQRAQNYIKRHGEEQALQNAISFKVARTQEEKMALLSELANVFSTKFKKAETEGNQSEVDRNYGNFMTSMNTLSNLITDTAQALSYLNLVGTIFETKTGALRFAKNQIEQSREGAMRNHEAMKMTAEDLIKQFDALSNEDFLKSKQVQDLIAKLQKDSPKSSKQRQAGKRLDDAIGKLREAAAAYKTQGIIFDPKSEAKKDVALTKALIDYIKALIQKLAIDANEKIQNVTAQVVDSVKKFSGEIGLTITDEQVNELVNDTVAREFEKKYKGDIRSAVKEFVDKKSGREELIQRIIDTEGITQEQATEFTDRLGGIFDEHLTREKNALVKRMTPKTKKPNKRRQEFFDKVIKLSNAGAVTDQQMDDTIAEIFDLPAMTPQIASQIETMVEEINKAPEGRFKNIAITKLTDYIAKQQRFNISDYMLASFRAGIFSGVDTQALNLMGNFFNVLELGTIMSMSNPMAGARFIASVRNPTSLSRAGMEALEIIKTGFDPRVAGDARRRVLEQRERTLFGLTLGLKGWKKALDPTLEQEKKFVFRALSAGDILFSQGINDALQGEMMVRRAKEKGLKGKDIAAYVREQMGFTPDNIQRALDQANNEALASQIPNDPTSISLRAKEIIEQQRDPDTVAKAREYAQEQILTNTPKGYLGIIARGINSMIQALPVISGLIPVVNFATNAMQRGVQYVPPIAMMRGAAHMAGRAIQGENISTIIKDDMQRLRNGDLEQEMRLRRFAAGTVSLIMMSLLLDEDDEGDNLLSQALGKKVKIHGFGPGTKMNRQKNYQLQESGWLPYSIQVGDTYYPYKNLPGANILLSTYGEYADAKRYGKLENKDALNRLFFAVANSITVISEMGFVTSLNNIMEALLGGDPKKWASLLARPVGGLFFPKFQQNLANLFDNKVYSGRDVQEVAIRSIPVLRAAVGDSIVNALGEPVHVNWWDRIELWNSESYTAYKPIWSANADKNYYFTVPTKSALEQTFERPMTTAEYNKFFELRGQEIVKEFKPGFVKLSSEEYDRRMDKVVQISTYRALVKMGVADTELLKDLNFHLNELLRLKTIGRDLKEDIIP